MRSTQVSNLLAAAVANTKRVTADQNVTLNAATNTTLTYALAANSNYLFKAFIRAETSLGGVTGSSLNFQIKALAAGAALVMVQGYGIKSGAFSITVDIVADATAVSTNIFPTDLGNSTTDTLWAIVIWGLITVGANATTLEIDALDVLATGTTVIKAGSFMEVSTVT